MLSLPPFWLAARTSVSAAVVELLGRAQDRAELVVGDHSRQAVGAEQVDVAVLGGDGVGVDLDVGLGAERASDDRALRMMLGGLGGDLAGALELGHERVVSGELLELAVAEAVGAAVAHMAEADVVADHLYRGQRRAHPSVGLVRHREVIDAAIGLAHHASELDLGRLGGIEVAPERLRGHRGGHLAGLGPAHAVGDREERRLQDQRVLVGAALAPDVGAARLLDDLECHD